MSPLRLHNQDILCVGVRRNVDSLDALFVNFLSTNEAWATYDAAWGILFRYIPVEENRPSKNSLGSYIPWIIRALKRYYFISKFEFHNDIISLGFNLVPTLSVYTTSYV